MGEPQTTENVILSTPQSLSHPRQHGIFYVNQKERLHRLETTSTESSDLRGQRIFHGRDKRLWIRGMAMESRTCTYVLQ